MQTIEDYDFSNKKALIRVDFNVPLDKDSFTVSDDTRIRAALPTIHHILNNGGSVVLMSHLGRPKGIDTTYSLSHILPKLSELIGREVKFTNDCIGEESYTISNNLQAGEVLLLENLRFYKEETAGDENFAQKLAQHGDVYVNDAFGTAHRAHASTTIIAQYFPKDKLCGKLLKNEIDAVGTFLNSSQKPLTAIIGGAKVSSKITIIEKMLDRVNNLIIGGGMAYTFIKAQGGSIGNSLVENDFLDTATHILEQARKKNVNLLLPVDSLIADKFSNDAVCQEVDIRTIPNEWMGLDIGQKTIAQMKEVVLNSKIILWNGPMGVFEFEKFQNGTVAIAKSVVEATKNGAYSLVGGGDSVAAIHAFQLADQVSYVSTGGGAMLEYLEGKELPGIKALN